MKGGQCSLWARGLRKIRQRDVNAAGRIALKRGVVAEDLVGSAEANDSFRIAHNRTFLRAGKFG
jgi:hypothetical protein